MEKSAKNPFSRTLLAALLILNLFVPVWAADYGLSNKTPEQDLGLVPPPPPSKDFPDESKIFHFDQGRWNRARQALDRGEEPGKEKPEEPAPEIAVSTATTPPVDEPGISVDLPYESGLSISGRKLIAIRLKETRRRAAKDNVPKDERDFEMRQELQVRIKGKVGRKITVNVDFDDTKEDKRDISVVYQGDPEELVQEAAFGDITLSLPSTEFVSYSKQLFGVRARLKYKRLQFMAIGSRTKGVTETKRFSGATQFERKEIPSTSYERRKHYRLAFNPTAELPLIQSSEVIYRDDRNPNNNVNTSTITAEDFAVNSSTYTGDFEQLFPGRDYTVDYVKGIISFKITINENDVLIANYNDKNNVPVAGPDFTAPGRRYKILKTAGDAPLSANPAEVSNRRELKTFYNIGRNRIIRDNGLGNFIFKTIDGNKNEVPISLTNGTVIRHPSDNINIDFEQGIFNIEPVGNEVSGDPGLYDPTPAPTNPFLFLLEYRYRLKSYLVKPNIVIGSERVLMNGRLLTRDLDYFIDYDSGFLTFFNEDEIDETTQIEVTYEYAPFGGQLGQTLVGTRTEYSVVPDRFFVGSTFLYTFSPKPTIVPDVRSTPNSLMVIEADSQLNNIKIPHLPLTMSLAGEVAQSRENPNLFGNAIVDSMEGIKQEDGTIMDTDFWQVARNNDGTITRPSGLSLGEGDVKLKEINPHAQTEDGQTQRVLTVGYNLGVSSISIVQPLSNAGRDFSKKQFLDIWVKGAGAAGAGVDMIVDAGQFNEDADADSRLDTEDKNFDGTLNLGEDVGWTFNDTAGEVPIGSGNGRVDTEDFDRDGQLDTNEFTPRVTPLFRLSNAVASGASIVNPDTRTEDPTVTDLGFTGWRLIHMPLSIAVAEETKFQTIKQVRLTLNGAVSTGSIILANLSFTGNRWEQAAATVGSSMTVAAVNNIEDANYVSLLGNGAYNDLYKDDDRERIREQALALRFDLAASSGAAISSATTRVDYSRSPLDFSKHKSFRFFLRTPTIAATNGATMFVQLGSDVDYFEYAVPLTPAYLNNWVLEGANMNDLNDDGTPDELVPLVAGSTVTKVGNPSLTSVGQIKIGVRNPTGSAINDGEVWINEIHLSGARTKVGAAKRVKADFSWDRWGTFGGTMRQVDRNFQTLTSQITNQDQKEASGYLTFNRLSFLPLSFTGSKSETLTPAALRTGDAALVSVLSEGRVESRTFSGKGELILPILPRIGFGYDKSVNDSNLLERIDERDTYTANTGFSIPWRPDLLPGSFLSFRPLPENISLNYRRQLYFLTYYPEKRTREFQATGATDDSRLTALFVNARTIEYTDDWSARSSFTLWNGFSMAPSYALKTVREKRKFGEEALAEADDILTGLGNTDPARDFTNAQSYEKSRSQQVGMTGSLRLLRWLEPRFSYNLSGTATNQLPSAFNTVASSTKTLDRTGDGELSWTFNVRELLTGFRPVQSLSFNNSYRIQDGDTYDNVPGSFKEWQKSLWIRKALDIEGATKRQQTKRDTVRTSGNWSPLDWLNFKGRAEPLKTLSLTGTYTKTDEHVETTNTARDTESTTWPDVVLSLRDLERVYGFQRWMDNSQLNVRTTRRKTETINIQFTENKDLSTDYRFTLWRKVDVFMTYAQNSRLDLNLATRVPNSTGDGYNYSLQTGLTWGAWRFTPSYAFRTDSAEDGLGKTIQDLTSKTYGFKARFDKAYPEGLRLPFTKRTFGNINRFTLDSGLQLEQRRSSLNVERDNTDTYTVNTTGEYEISRNFRLSFGGGGSMVRNIVKKDEGLFTIEINSQLVIQF